MLHQPIPTSHALIVAGPLKAHRRKPRASAERVVRARTTGRLDDCRLPDLVLLCKERGLKVTTKHVKSELLAMLASGQYVRPAALDRQNKARKARAAAASMGA